MKTSKSKKLQKTGTDLITRPKTEISAMDGLGMVPKSVEWLRNFNSPETKRKYAAFVKEFAKFARIENEADLVRIEPIHLIAWRDEMKNNNASNRTINVKISAVSSLYDYLCKKQVLKDNPAVNVKRKNVNRKKVETRTITNRQARKMIDAPNQETMTGLRDAVIMHIFFYTGCRIAEISRLKVKDYYIDHKYKVLDLTLKGDKRNAVAIHPEVVIVIDKYLERQGHGNEADSPLVLAAKRAELRRHLTPKQINQIFHKYAKIVKLPKGVTPHTPRATLATDLFKQGVHPKHIQNLLGHSDISTTMMYDKSTAEYRDSGSFKARW